jgi:two-component system sensor histidine kinase UhpB
MNQLPSLLIVDDKKENLFLLEAIINHIKVNLIKALSGTEALEKTRGVELALAIIDVRMPEMDGYELAMKLNKERLEDKVPVIFLTAEYFNEDDVSKGYDSGAVDYIFKPINRQILLSKINVFLDLFGQRQTIFRNAVQLGKYADDLKESNISLRKSEEKYRNYIDYAPDGVFVTDEIGHFLEVNDAVCRITGYSKNELLRMSVLDILGEESQDEMKMQFENVPKSGILKADLSFIHKKESTRWWSINAVVLDDKRLLAFAKDITTRKKMEEDLKSSLKQLQQLSKYMEKARESERKTIARELHDDLGQALTAVKIDLGIIKQRVADQELTLRISKASDLVGKTIKTVQRLTSQLRPEIIDDLGLEAAIKWYTKDFSQRNEIEIYLDMDSEIPLSPDDSLTVFRILQESLTNIARHSGANRVEISFSNDNGIIHFKISDNGVGIKEEGLNSKKSFGIIGIKERAIALSGSCNIYSKNGEGTVIHLTFPLNKK